MVRVVKIAMVFVENVSTNIQNVHLFAIASFVPMCKHNKSLLI